MKAIISKLMGCSFERGMDIKASEIACHIGEEEAFDDKVIQVSPKRFKEIKDAYNNIITNEYMELIKDKFVKDGTFKNRYEVYLFNYAVCDLTIKAIEYGSFKIAKVKSSREKAEQGYRELMLYLIENSYDKEVEKLSSILIEDEGTKELLTIDKFMNNYKDYMNDMFKYIDNEGINEDRFNERIFPKIKKATKNYWQEFETENINRVEQNKTILSSTQEIDILNKNMYRLKSDEDKENLYIQECKNYYMYKKMNIKTLELRHQRYHSKNISKL